MSSETRIRTRHPTRADRERELGERLSSLTKQLSYRQIGDATGYPPETVRRYMLGQAVRTDFIVRLCEAFELDANYILFGKSRSPALPELRLSSTRDLLSEIGRRFSQVEDTQIGISAAFQSFLEDE